MEEFSFLDDAAGHPQHAPQPVAVVNHHHQHPAAAAAAVDRRRHTAAAAQQQHYDHSLFTQVQELQASNYQQASYIAELESRIQDLASTQLPVVPAAQRRRVDQHPPPDSDIDIDDDSNVDDTSSNNNNTCIHCGKQKRLPEPKEKDDSAPPSAAAATASMALQQPQYGRRECPLTTERGMIDGRSNAKLAFEEKCELLREFKAEFGHLLIGSNPPEKYRPLCRFVMRQRQKFRGHAAGIPMTAIDMERSRRLQELGLNMTPVSRESNHRAEFDTMLPQVRAFQETHGHCCVLAVEGSKDSALCKFVESHRSYLRKYRRMQQAEQEKSNGGGEQENDDDTPATTAGAQDNGDKDSDNHAQNSPTTTTEGGQTTTEATSQDNDVEMHEIQGDSAPHTPLKRKRKNRHPSLWQGPPKWFSDHMVQELEALDDHYINIDDEKISALFKDLQKTCKLVNRGLGAHGWHTNLESFRFFFKENGHGHVPLQGSSQTSIQAFVKNERKIYNAIESKKIENCPLLERRIELLESSGFIFDAEILQKENDRLLAIAAEKSRRQVFMKTAQYRLEQAEARQLEIKQEMQEARQQEKDAKARIAAIGSEMTNNRKKVLEAKAEADKDPVGSKVYVRARGETKPGGSGKVIRSSQIKVLAETIQYYDVEFNEGRKEMYVEGRYVTFENDAAALLGLSREESRQTQQPRRRDTRSASKQK